MKLLATVMTVMILAASCASEEQVATVPTSTVLTHLEHRDVLDRLGGEICAGRKIPDRVVLSKSGESQYSFGYVAWCEDGALIYEDGLISESPCYLEADWDGPVPDSCLR